MALGRDRVYFVSFQCSALFQGFCHALNPMPVKADQFVCPSPKACLVSFPYIIANIAGATDADDLD